MLHKLRKQQFRIFEKVLKWKYAASQQDHNELLYRRCISIMTFYSVFDAETAELCPNNVLHNVLHKMRKSSMVLEVTIFNRHQLS